MSLLPAPLSAPDSRSGHASPEALLRTSDALARELAATAVERDRKGGHAAAEREQIRASGLLTLTIPAEFGGTGADWATFNATLRRLAQADSALAHLYGFHHLQMATLLLYGTPAQQRQQFEDTVTQRLFWGNALNPLDQRAVATESDDGWIFNGLKSFSSGSVGSDRMVVSAWHRPTGSLVIATTPTRRGGVRVRSDWDAFGQKQTDSGTVEFERVAIAHADVLVAPGAAHTPRMTLRPLVSQLIMTNLYLGIAIGAYDEARVYTREQARPWAGSGVTRAIDDPIVQHRYGELKLLIRAAASVADDAARQLDAAFARGNAIDSAQRGELAIAISEAKVLAHRAAMDISSQFFELAGARATSQKLGLDRFWRNARVHTLHDPVDMKLRDIGRHALDGLAPTPGSYS
jgi:alkylation response protein AidB-like acyl-CoA dehydrogenase